MAILSDIGTRNIGNNVPIASISVSLASGSILCLHLSFALWERTRKQGDLFSQKIVMSTCSYTIHSCQLQIYTQADWMEGSCMTLRTARSIFCSNICQKGQCNKGISIHVYNILGCYEA